MKRFFLGLGLVLFCGSTTFAQNCSSFKKAHCDGYAKKHCLKSSVTFAAAMDDNIIPIKDEQSYKTNYVRKVECSMTGTVTYEDVKFDRSAGTFVAKSQCTPSQMYRCATSKASNCRVECLQSSKAAQVTLYTSEKKERT
ncbi:MAG: hypothetical protein OEQ53_15845 [Saprospiraceae bacterium]|nr:hypothetical protein [Saprospiraceae bacterium]